MTLVTAVVVAAGLGAGIAALLTAARWFAERRAGGDPSAALVDHIEAALPHIQCGQCGYPGCRPYAEAVAQGAAIDLCPPGGPDTARALAELLGRPSPSVAEPGQRVAVIDEPRCIGCGRCLPACPVDAIVGAASYMHTVIAERCTGCELCLPPCPVDCIELVDVERERWIWPAR